MKSLTNSEKNLVKKTPFTIYLGVASGKFYTKRKGEERQKAELGRKLIYVEDFISGNSDEMDVKGDQYCQSFYDYNDTIKIIDKSITDGNNVFEFNNFKDAKKAFPKVNFQKNIVLFDVKTQEIGIFSLSGHSHGQWIDFMKRVEEGNNGFTVSKFFYTPNMKQTSNKPEKHLVEIENDLSLFSVKTLCEYLNNSKSAADCAELMNNSGDFEKTLNEQHILNAIKDGVKTKILIVAPYFESTKVTSKEMEEAKIVTEKSKISDWMVKNVFGYPNANTKQEDEKTILDQAFEDANENQEAVEESKMVD